jgi:murein DD-endopeptidase MepM/ murein hydrolase activator NlpD
MPNSYIFTLIKSYQSIHLKKKHTQAVFKNAKQTNNLLDKFNLSSLKILKVYTLTSLKINKTSVLIIAVLLTVTLLYAFASPSAKTIQTHKELLLEIPSNPVLSLTATESIDNTKWQQITIKKGQSLSSIFKDLKLSQTLLYNIVHLNKDAKLLTKIFPGAVLSFALSDTGEFSQLKYNISESQELIVAQEIETDKLSTQIIEHPTEVNVKTSNGIITGSLFNAGKASGLSDAMVMKLANIFAWDIDFVLDIRQGDSFSLIYEQIYQNGEFLRDGKIIAASFTNQGDTYKAVAFDDGKGFSYYNPEGRNMKKAFLRAPLNFSYISSSFNPKRYHPVQKRVKPHRGIDYAAPRGTPVFAAGDGVVTRSSYNKYNGNHVFIKHPSGIITKYLHFTKRMVKKGQRVRQGQTIGTVGSTGMATGPHLHYEFVLNGVHRNPRTVKLPKASPLAKAKMPEFKAFAAPILSQLDSIDMNVKNIAQQQINKSKSS